MALTSVNPIRLADAHLMCAGEFVLSPAGSLGWLAHLPHALQSLSPDAQVAASLVMACAGDEVRTGLALRLRMHDMLCTPARCEEARESCMPAFIRLLEEDGLSPRRPLGGEGVLALLPRQDFRLLRRKTARIDVALPQPLTHEGMTRLLRRYPGSGLCVTLIPTPEQDESFELLLTCWGLPQAGLALLPLEECALPDPLLAGFEMLYDPWAMLRRVREGSDPALSRVSARELQLLLGPWQPPAPAAPAPESPAAEALADIHALLDGVSALREQMISNTQTYKAALRRQIDLATGEALRQTSESVRQLTAQLAAVPGMQRIQMADTLERLQSRIRSLTPAQAAEEARRAGLDRPIDASMLFRMGFTSEEEMRAQGLSDDQLTLLRSAVHQHGQCPEPAGSTKNCIAYANMLGCLYESLIMQRFAPLYRVTGGYAKAHLLSNFTRVDWDHCRRLADYAAPRAALLRPMTQADWAAWLTVCNAMRLLRNRIHSDEDTICFICRDELDAALNAFLLPGRDQKLHLLSLPCFSDAPPSWSREFAPQLPESWAGTTPAAQRDHVRRHIAGRISAFQPSLLQFLLCCGRLCPEEVTA